MQLQDVGVVIPTYNEAELLPLILSDLKAIGFSKILVVDANSFDNTIQVAQKSGVTYCISQNKNRAVQMNLGAQKLQTHFILFVHADVRFLSLDKEFLLRTINRIDFSFGNFKLKFDSKHWFLRLNEKFSHFKLGAFQFGDQGLLVNKIIFNEVRGFNEALCFMEGNDIVRRLKEKSNFIKLDSTLLVSARKYEEIGVYRLQFSYFIIYFLARIGVPQKKVKLAFKKIFGGS